MLRLNALGIGPETYRALFTPVLIKKLPAELQLNLVRKIPLAERKLTRIMEVFKEDLEARERATAIDSLSRGKPSLPHRGGKEITSQSTAFLNTNTDGPSCCYCGQEGFIHELQEVLIHGGQKANHSRI